MTKHDQAAGATNGTTVLFDQALAASAAQQHDTSIELLTHLLQSEPGHARARHLLGAEYAQTGKIGDAIVELAVALELDTHMVIARFQLGLLLLTSGKADQAASIWAPLDALGAGHTLNLFKKGMLQMAAGDYAASRASLNAALAENTDLPFLNGEIATALRGLDQVRDAPAESDGSHILVSTYSGDTPTP